MGNGDRAWSVKKKEKKSWGWGKIKNRGKLEMRDGARRIKWGQDKRYDGNGEMWNGLLVLPIYCYKNTENSFLTSLTNILHNLVS